MRISTISKSRIFKSGLLAGLILFIASAFAGDELYPVRSTVPVKVTHSDDNRDRNAMNNTATIKWEETFDVTTIPAGWQTIDNDASGSDWTFTQGVDFTSGDSVRPEMGQSFFFSNFNNANGSGLIDEWIITPRLPVIEAGDTLSFYTGAIGGQFADSLKVWVSTTDSLPGSFTEIAYFRAPGPTGNWTRFDFDMSSFAGNNVFVAVNYYVVNGGPTGTDSDNIWVDHFILEGNVTGIEVNPRPGIADGFALEQNYPNPFNPTTTINFTIPASEQVLLNVYNVAGQLVQTLVNAPMNAGNYEVSFAATDLPSGIYFYQIRAGAYRATKRMILMQ